MNARALGCKAGLKTRLYVVLVSSVVMLGGDVARGQAPRATPPAPATAADQFPGLVFRNIGPATMGGRVDDLAVLESNPAVFYVGTATGGLWKTVNNGTTWTVLASFGLIAMSPIETASSMSSKSTVQVVPLLTVFHKPPVAVPT